MATLYAAKRLYLSKSRGCKMTFQYSFSDIVENINDSYKFFEPSEFDDVFEKKWMKRHDTDGIFRYKLNIKSEKVLPGKFKFLLQKNLDRATNRRLPDTIEKINQTFDHNKFNFNKVSKNEHIFEIKNIADESKFKSILMVNASPICFGHSLLCPNIDECLPQIITLNSLELLCHIMFLSSNTDLRAGFNSLCGMASVNHLHYHILILNYRLPIENIECLNLKGPLYELGGNYPAKCFCFQIKSKHEITEICAHINTLISFLMDNNIAHNLYMTKGEDFNEKDKKSLRIFIWVRSSSFGAKEMTFFNLAICEFSGQFPVKTAEDYEILSESTIINVLEETTQPIFFEIKEKVIALY